MFDILVILQTHSKSNASQNERYVKYPKSEISKRCFLSLVNTINYCKSKEPGINYKLIVLDDNSDEDFLTIIKQTADYQNFNIELKSTSKRGIMSSIGEMYSIGKDQGKDLVYFAQDDYLHYETALWEMVDSYFKFKDLSGMEVCIYPFDDPFRYKLGYFSRVVLGAKRHWRNAYHTASCFMMSHKTIVDNWDLFGEFENLPYDKYCEDRTINRLFNQMEGFPKREIKHLLFTPIPSLAFHLQDNSTKDPYLDWQNLWEKFEDTEVKSLSLPDGKIVVNIGPGNVKLKDSGFTEDLVDYNEITVDLDKSNNPTILSDMTNLSQLKSNSVNCVYSSHSLEHIAPHKISNCLAEWYRVIKPSGEIRIIVPNLKFISNYISSGKILDVVYESDAGPVSAIDIIYGHRGYIASGNEFMQHKTGFTKESAEIILQINNYSHFKVQEFNSELLIRIIKPLG